MGIQVKVIGLKGEEEIIDLCDNNEQLKKMSVMQLKVKITRDLKTGEAIRIIFRTQTLEEDKLLVFYGIRHMSTVHTLLKLPGGF